MVTNVTSLLKTVKAVEDEATRGTRALEATIECIKQELTVRAPRWPEARRLLSAKPAQTGSAISVSFIRCKNREAFCPFFSFVIWPHSFLPASLSGPGGFYQLLSVCESQVQAETGRTIQNIGGFF